MKRLFYIIIILFLTIFLYSCEGIGNIGSINIGNYLSKNTNNTTTVNECSTTKEKTLLNVDDLNLNFTYDGRVLEYKVPDELIPEGIELEYKNNIQIEPGTYEVTISFIDTTGTYLELEDIIVYLTIEKIKVPTPTLYLENVVYDSLEHTFLESTDLYTVTNNTATNAGTYVLTATLNDTDYYEWEDENFNGDIQYEILKATYDMSYVSFTSKEFLYDAQEHEILIEGVLPDGVSVEYINNKLTDVRSIVSIARFNGDYNNYERIKDILASLTVLSSSNYADIINSGDILIEEYYGCLTVPNIIDILDLNDIIEVSYGATWYLSTDILLENIIDTKICTLEEGNNTFYITVTSEDKTKVNVYRIVIRRKPIYTISFFTYNSSNIDNQYVEEGNKATIPEDPIRTGYTFIEWDFDFDRSINTNQEIIAIFSANKYTIYYDYDDGKNNSASQIVTYGSTFNLFYPPSRLGYTFIRYEYNSKLITSGTYIYAEDITVKAIWDIISYNIVYNLNDGINDELNPTTYTVLDSITLKDPTKVGYVFESWSDNGVIEKGTTGDLTFEANFTPSTNTKYCVKYYLENVDNHFFTNTETNEFTGTTDSVPSIDVKDYLNYSINEDLSTINKVINPDGSSVYKLYYNRTDKCPEIVEYSISEPNCLNHIIISITFNENIKIIGDSPSLITYINGDMNSVAIFEHIEYPMYTVASFVLDLNTLDYDGVINYFELKSIVNYQNIYDKTKFNNSFKSVIDNGGLYLPIKTVNDTNYNLNLETSINMETLVKVTDDFDTLPKNVQTLTDISIVIHDNDRLIIRIKKTEEEINRYVVRLNGEVIDNIFEGRDKKYVYPGIYDIYIEDVNGLIYSQQIEFNIDIDIVFMYYVDDYEMYKRYDGNIDAFKVSTGFDTYSYILTNKSIRLIDIIDYEHEIISNLSDNIECIYNTFHTSVLINFTDDFMVTFYNYYIPEIYHTYYVIYND